MSGFLYSIHLYDNSTMHILPYILLVSAGISTRGQNCSTLDNRLKIGTYQVYSHGDAQNYCSDQGICLEA